MRMASSFSKSKSKISSFPFLHFFYCCTINPSLFLYSNKFYLNEPNGSATYSTRIPWQNFPLSIISNTTKKKKTLNSKNQQQAKLKAAIVNSGSIRSRKEEEEGEGKEEAL